MTDFAGVDPHRVRVLANRLKDLADVLVRVAPTTRSKFDEWGGTLNLSQLHQQAVQVGDDARKMALRADEALNLLRQPNGAAFCTPDGDWVNIPWDTKDINATQEARQEAATLKKALDNPKDAASREIIAEIGQSPGRPPGRLGLHDRVHDRRRRHRCHQGSGGTPRRRRHTQRRRPHQGLRKDPRPVRSSHPDHEHPRRQGRLPPTGPQLPRCTDRPTRRRHVVGRHAVQVRPLRRQVGPDGALRRQRGDAGLA